MDKLNLIVDIRFNLSIFCACVCLCVCDIVSVEMDESEPSMKTVSDVSESTLIYNN